MAIAEQGFLIVEGFRFRTSKINNPSVHQFALKLVVAILVRNSKMRIKPFLVLITGCLFGASCGIEIECENIIQQEIASPDGSKRIVLFSRECGATTGSNTQASLLMANEVLPDDESGNVFIIDQGSAQVSWRDESIIMVKLSSSSRRLKTETKVRGVHIEYQ